MTRDKGALAKDDRLDALAMAVAYWSKAADRATRNYAVAEAIETLNLGLADIDRLDPGEHQDRLATARGRFEGPRRRPDACRR